MRTAACPHIYHDDPDRTVTVYEYAVPYLALAMLEEWRDLGTTMVHVRPFCEERGIKFAQRKWYVDHRRLESWKAGPTSGMRVNILLFETIEDQRTVAQAFPGRLF